MLKVLKAIFHQDSILKKTSLKEWWKLQTSQMLFLTMAGGIQACQPFLFTNCLHLLPSLMQLYSSGLRDATASLNSSCTGAIFTKRIREGQWVQQDGWDGVY